MFEQKKLPALDKKLSIQTSLKIGRPGDKYEQEADRVADYVMRSSPVDPIQMQTEEEEEELQMKCEHCEEDELQMKPQLQLKNGTSFKASPDISSKIKSTKGIGSALTPAQQREMSSKIGADFSGVNIHTDSDAVQMNRELGSRAFTLGNDIYFNNGEYNPSSSVGKHLLAHELTHVLQQSSVNSKIQKQDDEVNTSIPLSIDEKKDLATLTRDLIPFAADAYMKACRDKEDKLKAAAARKAELATTVLELGLVFITPSFTKTVSNILMGVSNKLKGEALAKAVESAENSIRGGLLRANFQIWGKNLKEGAKKAVASSDPAKYVSEIESLAPAAFREATKQVTHHLPDEELIANAAYWNSDEVVNSSFWENFISKEVTMFDMLLGSINSPAISWRTPPEHFGAVGYIVNDKGEYVTGHNGSRMVVVNFVKGDNTDVIYYIPPRFEASAISKHISEYGWAPNENKFVCDGASAKKYKP